MTREEIIYDIMMQATKLQVPDDSRFNEPHYIGYLVDEKRAKEIRDTYVRSGVIDPTWVQDMGVMNLTKVESSDDPNVADCGLIFGKVTVPPIVSFKSGDLGIYSITSKCRTERYYPVENMDKFMQIINFGRTRANWNYYMRIGNSIYTYPFKKQIAARLILEHPLDGYVLLTENVANDALVAGSGYSVVSGPITHNSVIYTSGQTFTAVNTTYTGTGIVRNNPEKRKLTNKDEYPLGATALEVVKQKIFSEELNEERKRLSDNRVDSVDETISKENGQ